MMTPGLTALTRTPRPASSNAEQRVSWSTADLDMQYAKTPGNYTETGDAGGMGDCSSFLHPSLTEV